MTSPRLTDWIDGSVKPVRDGLYQRDYGLSKVYCRYAQGQWRVGWRYIRHAAKERAESATQNLPWRGLAEAPK